MTRLTWGAPAERFYETGVDRGVLYVGNNPGVAWNGLLSVDESPSGGEARPAYLDGIKFRNISSAEEFEATITALSCPKEFGPCEGNTSIQNGLIATQQPRKTFNLSYRTLVGSAADENAGYKIHLVYNALAGPSSVPNASMAGDVSPVNFSWSITTVPPAATGLKPTAHFIVDSRYSLVTPLADLEDILYGTPSVNSRIPTVSELIALFTP